MRIGLKLTGAFLAIALLVAAAGYLAQRTGRELKQQIERLSHNAIRRNAAVSEVTFALYAEQLIAHRLIAARRRSQIESDLNELADDRVDTIGVDGFHELAEPIRMLVQESSEPLQEEFDRHRELMTQFVDLLDEDVDAAEQMLEGPVLSHFEGKLLPILLAVREQAERESTGGIRGAERALAVADQRRGMLLVAAAAVAVSIGLVMSRSIGKPLGILQRAAQQIGQGRLDTRVEVRSRDEIGTLAASLNRMAAQFKEKTVSKDHVDNIIRSMREMLIVADEQLRIRVVNPAACHELGYSSDELIDRPLQDLFTEDNLFPKGQLTPLVATGTEGTMQTQSGQQVPVHFSAAEMHDEAGAPTGIVCVALNVTRQKETENELRRSLHEKELLLKEVHHRVKNNLQVISSLLSLQAQEIRDPHMNRLFQESQARVRSMALVHEQLYRSDDLARIDFAAYVEELVEHLRQGYGPSAVPIRFVIDVQRMPLLLDLAIPCGMIVNELVANALEHAFPKDHPGEIRVVFREEGGEYRLVVSDNGQGMQAGTPTGARTSIGLKVVEALTRQIHGRLEHASQDGTTFTLFFQKSEPCQTN